MDAFWSRKGILEVVDDLESLAMDFKGNLSGQDLVQDRRFGLAVYPGAFLGNDAVSVLVDLVQDLAEETPGYEEHKVTRAEALVVGRKMSERFQLFESAFVLKSMDHELNDNRFQFYKFKHNLPCDVVNTKHGMKASDYVIMLKSHVSVEDRTYRLRTYPRCFVGSQAVDVMMKERMAISRKDAVKLILKLNKKFSCFQHVCDEEITFDDAHYFYRFKWDQELLNDGKHGTKISAMNCAIDALTGNEDDTTAFQLTSESLSFERS